MQDYPFRLLYRRLIKHGKARGAGVIMEPCVRWRNIYLFGFVPVCGIIGCITISSFNISINENCLIFSFSMMLFFAQESRSSRELNISSSVSPSFRVRCRAQQDR